MSPLGRKLGFPRTKFVLHHQHRTFFGLQRTPAPKAPMMGYLVLQGLAVVLIGDFAFATLAGQKTVVREVAQTAGFWAGPKEFKEVHGRE